VLNGLKNTDQSLWLYSKILPYIRGKNRKVGSEHYIQCPFCDEAHTSSHPSTAMRGGYNIFEQVFHCFRCDYRTNGLKLYEKLSGLNSKELIPEYLEFINRGGKRGVNFSNFLSTSSISSSSHGNLSSSVGRSKVEYDFQPIPPKMRGELTERGRKYLEGRKIMQSPNLPSYARFYSATYSSKAYGNKPYEVVVIPWYLDGDEWGYQWRFIDGDVPFPKYGFPKNSGKKIYGLDSVSSSFPYIICTEGVFDSLWVKNGVAIGGKSVTDYQRSVLEERFPKHKIVYGFDNDEHGIDAMLGDFSTTDDHMLFYWKDVAGKAKDLNEFAMGGNERYFFDEKHITSRLFSPIELQLKLNNPFA